MKKHVILFLAANPLTSDRLEIDRECADIERELEMVPHRDDFQFVSRWAVGVDELMRHLNKLAPTVIHFSGHGGGNSGLLFQDEQGHPQPVSARALAMMIDAAARDVRVVVLNACYTDAQAEVLRAKVDCVVGMAGAIGDDAARAFAIRFYGALGNRRSIGNAVDQGVAALAAKQLPDEVMPRCVTSDGIDANHVFLHRLKPDAIVSGRNDEPMTTAATMRSGDSPRPIETKSGRMDPGAVYSDPGSQEMTPDAQLSSVYFDNGHGQSRWSETGYPPRRLDTTFAGLAELLTEHKLACATGKEQLCRDLLSRYGLLLLPPPAGSFKPEHFFGGKWHRTENSYVARTELEAILEFIEDGGRLWAFAYRFGDQFTGTNIGELAAALGVLLNSDAVIDLDVVETHHPLHTTFLTNAQHIITDWGRKGVHQIVWRPTASFNILPRSSAFPVVLSPSSCVRLSWSTLSPDYQPAPLCVAGTFGRGKFVFCGGPHAFESSDLGLLSKGDNVRFSRNIVSWLLAKPIAQADSNATNSFDVNAHHYQNPRLNEVQLSWSRLANSEASQGKERAFEDFARLFMEDCGIFKIVSNNKRDPNRDLEVDLVYECLSHKPLWAGSNGLVPVGCKNQNTPIEAAEITGFVHKIAMLDSRIGIFFGRRFSEDAHAAMHDVRLTYKIIIGLISDDELETYVRGIASAQKIIETCVIKSRIE